MSLTINEYFGRVPSRLDELYHGNSKHSPTRVSFATRLQVAQRDRWVHEAHRARRGRYRSYPRNGRVQLPGAPLPLSLSLEEAIAGRRSHRQFGEQSISIAELSTLLAMSYGAGQGRAGRRGRPTPSGGGLYPLDLYVLQVAGRSACEGAYHYHPGEHALQRVRPVCEIADLEASSMYPETVRAASAILVIVGDLERCRFKYGERAYRLALLEAGHVSQTLYLIAAALRIGIVALDGFYDDRVHALLDVDGVSEIALTSLAVGRLP